MVALDRLNPQGRSLEFIAITGMHRSGTSLAARIVNLLGADIGPDDGLMPPKRDNPSGFWEKLSVTRLNDEILAAFGGRWSDPPDLPEGWHETRKLERFRRRAADIVSEGFTGDLRMFKDPRASLVLPFWRAAAPISRTLVCTRSPAAVAHSLKRRNRIGAERADRLFVRYQVDAYLDGVDPVVVPFEALVADPVGWARRLADTLGLDAPSREVERAVADYVDQGLIHAPLDVGDVPEALGEAAEVDGLLRTAGEREIGIAFGAIRGRLAAEAELHRERSRAHRIREERDAFERHRNEVIGDRDTLLADRAEVEARYAKTAQQRDELIADRDRALALRDEAEAALAETARQRDELIADRDRALELRDEAARDRDEAVRAAADALDEAIADREQALEMLADVRHERDEASREVRQVIRDRERVTAEQTKLATETVGRELVESEEERARLGARLETARGDLEVVKARLEFFEDRYRKSLRGRTARLWRRTRSRGGA